MMFSPNEDVGCWTRMLNIGLIKYYGTSRGVSASPGIIVFLMV